MKLGDIPRARGGGAGRKASGVGRRLNGEHASNSRSTRRVVNRQEEGLASGLVDVPRHWTALRVRRDLLDSVLRAV